MNRKLLLPFVMVSLTGCGHAVGPRQLDERLAEAVGEPGLVRFQSSAGPVDADDDLADTLTLPEAVRLTLANDSRIQAALARVHAARADARQALLLPNPVLDVAFRFPEGGGNPVIEAGLAADFLTLLQRPRRARAADHRLRAASEEALVAVLDAVAEVQEHYTAMQALDEQITVAARRRALLARQLELSEEKLKVGEGTRLEVAELNARRISLDAETAERQLERTDERLMLTRLIGQPSSQAQWAVSGWVAPDHAVVTEREWVTAALSNRPEVLASRWELAALGDEVALAALDGSELGIAAEREDRWTAGPSLSVPIPLFDWGQARRAKAHAERVEARHKFTQARREAVEEARRAYAALVASRRAVEQARDELVPLQRQRRDEAEASYRVGETDLTALLLAEQDLHEARERLIGLQQKASTAWFRLQRAVGGPSVATSVATTRVGPDLDPSR